MPTHISVNIENRDDESEMTKSELHALDHLLARLESAYAGSAIHQSVSTLCDVLSDIDAMGRDAWNHSQ